MRLVYLREYLVPQKGREGGREALQREGGRERERERER
jgi:hypothetical protein